MKMYNFTGIYSNKSVVLRPETMRDGINHEQSVIMLLPTIYTFTVDENEQIVFEPLGDADKTIIIEFYDYIREQIKTGVLSVCTEDDGVWYSDIVENFNERNRFILSLDGAITDIEKLCSDASEDVEIVVEPFLVDSANKTYRIAIQTAINK